MYLIIEILNKQYKIYKNLKIKIDKLKLNLNSLIILNKVLLISSKKLFIINKNLLNKIFITARILKHCKYRKLNILKFKRRKGYSKKIGFKKDYSLIIIENINLNFLNINGSKKIWRFF